MCECVCYWWCEQCVSMHVNVYMCVVAMKYAMCACDVIRVLNESVNMSAIVCLLSNILCVGYILITLCMYVCMYVSI